MLKTITHCLVAFGLLLTACGPARPAATPSAAPASKAAPAATPAPLPPAEPILPIVLSRRTDENGAGLRRPDIVLHFNRAMDQASVAAALTVRPATSFTLSWANSGVDLHLAPERPLAPDTHLTFALARTARDLEGNALARAENWSYHATDVVASIVTPDLPGPNAPIVMILNYDLQAWSVERAFSLTPAVPGRSVYDEQHDVLTFTPSVTLTAGVDYTWRIDRPLWDSADQPMQVDLSGRFETAPLAQFTPTNGDSAAHLAQGVTMRFIEDVDPASVEAAFSITPATPGTLRWDDPRTLVFTPTGGFFAASTHYTVRLDSSVRLAGGRSGLAKSVGVTFVTEAEHRLADFGIGSKAQVVDTQGRRGVQFVYDGSAPTVVATFTLRALQLDDFLAGAARTTSYWEIDAGTVEPPPDLSADPIAARWEFDGAGVSRPANDYDSYRLETTIPADVAPGLYALELTAGTGRDVLWVALTSLAVQVRRSNDQMLAWVTDVNGAPTPGASVTLVDAKGRSLASTTSDDDGLAKFDLADVGGVAWVIAEALGDRTITGLNGTWQAAEPSAVTPVKAGSPHAAFITTDRPIYRPGDVVHFKAVLRRDDDGVLSVEPDREVVVRLRDARDNIVRTIYLRTDAFGSVDSLFRLAQGAMLGDYAIEVIDGAESHRQPFQVEEYRKPEIDIALSTDASGYVAGQSIRGTIDSRYFFDAPVPNASVTVTLYDIYSFCYEAQDCSDTSWTPQSAGSIKGTTDATGRFVFTTTATSDALYQYDSAAQAPVTIGIEATVTDGEGEPVSAHRLLTVYPSEAVLSWVTRGGLRQPGEAVTLRLRISDIAGAPVAGQALRLDVRGWNERGLDYSDVLSQARLTSDAEGLVTAELPALEAGYYELAAHVIDSRGRDVVLSDWMWVFSGAAAYPDRAGVFGVEADRERYAPGDQAVLTVRSNFSGPALLSLGRTGLMREQVVTLHSPITRVTVPILPEDAPNLNVSVTAWRPEVDAQGQPRVFDPSAYNNQPDSRLVSARTVLLVPPIEKRLDITVTPDHEHYAAGAQATFDIHVSDSNGQPAQAQLTLALVDEAIFRLREEAAGPIFDAFYFPHASAVSGFGSFLPFRWLMIWDGGGCGGGGGGVGPGLQPRNNFADTALWEPSLVTDANGDARLTVTLPDTLTTWRLTARAVTIATQVGETTTQIVTQQDLNVRPLLPDTLTTGDDVDLTAMVHNNTDAARSVDAGLLMSGGFELRDPLTQRVTVPARSTAVVTWRARALTAGEVKLTFWTMDPNDHTRRDSIELPVIVQPLAVPDLKTQVGEVASSRTLTVMRPADVLALSRVDLTLSGSIAGNITDGLVYLTGYPYGCVEQTMSRALPNAVVAHAFRELGLTEALDGADLARKIDASVQRLYGFQHDDGGWGWWTDDATDDYQTAWVIFGLTQTRAAGYEVDSAVIARGADYLSERIEMLDDHTKAFALYSLALAGRGDLVATQKAAANGGRLDAFSRASLTLALHLLGDDTGAREQLALLTAAAQRENGRAYWSGADHDGHYHEKTMASTTRSTALALSALVALSPDDALVIESVRYLMSQRRADGWGSTNETSFTILALTDDLLARERGTPAAQYTVTVNGVEVARGQLGNGRLTTTVTLPADALQVGANTISITSAGRTVFYTATERWYTEVARVPRAGVIDVQRRYTTARGGNPVSTFNVGDLVRVTLTVDLPRDGSFMLVEDMIPGGLEPINERLNTSSYDRSAFEACMWSSDCDVYHWERYGYNQKEIRSDRVSFFITTLSAGRHTFSYLARAVRSGRFTALPAIATAMYDEAMWGRGDSVGVYVRP